MSDKQPVNVVLCWHMHQPYYKDFSDGSYRLPWTYLHAIKDYVDMVAHIEADPDARCVVNFAPTLLEQIEDYCRMLNAFMQERTPLSDPLLNALAVGSDAQTSLSSTEIVLACLKANRERLIDRFPPYQQLARMSEMFLQEEDAHLYINNVFLDDLLVWYHIAWLGETVRRSDERVIRLIDKGNAFDEDDRQQLIAIIHELISQLLPRYALLAKKGQIELSMTPYAHPIVPLLLDIDSAREAMPDVDLPANTVYPGGQERSLWHIQKGREVFKRIFDVEPSGCWPSEGSISQDAIEVFSQAGFQWVASGEQVIKNSLNGEKKVDGHPACVAYQLKNLETKMFFRDDGLSDLIGFTYSNWHADDAVSNLIHHILSIADSEKNSAEKVVPIILDGENAWEYYHENGYYFLRALYEKLSSHERIRLVRFKDCIQQPVETVVLDKLVAGSWVYGTFSTWIGDKDKNHAWDMLIEAKKICDSVLSGENLPEEKRAEIEQQLAVCEGSDWFWWFGDYNPAQAVKDFDEMYRAHLRYLYRLMEQDVPEVLQHPFATGHGDPSLGGVMRRGSEN